MLGTGVARAVAIIVPEVPRLERMDRLPAASTPSAAGLNDLRHPATQFLVVRPVTTLRGGQTHSAPLAFAIFMPLAQLPAAVAVVVAIAAGQL